MHANIKNYYNLFSKDYYHLLAITLLSIFPIFFFIGTGVLNLGIILLDLIFYKIFKKKNLIFLKIIFFIRCNFMV